MLSEMKSGLGLLRLMPADKQGCLEERNSSRLSWAIQSFLWEIQEVLNKSEGNLAAKPCTCGFKPILVLTLISSSGVFCCDPSW